MPTNTPNLNLIKPLVSEHYDVVVANANNDILDTAVGDMYSKSEVDGLVAGKQDALVSGTNIKTINGNSVLGVGDIPTMLPKNWIINGMFDVWQRGTSIINAVSAETYNVDRYATFLASGTTSTTSQQAFAVGQTDVPNNPKFFSRNVVVSGGGIASRCMFQQKIEDVTKLAGKTIAISFWAKADANKNISIEFVQDFGAGGSAGITTLGVQKFALTTSWQRITKIITLPSVTGKTLVSGHNLRFGIWFDAGSNFNTRTDSLGHQSGTFDIANVSLVEGSVAVECQNQPYADVLRDCQRYYFRLGKGASNSIFAIGIGENATRTKFLINLPLNFRRLPISSDVSFSDLSVFNVAVATYVVTAITVDRAMNELLILNIDVASGGSARVPMLLIETTASGHLAINVEL